ncbi:MAG: UDP-N-acetylmuramoyl-L-alanyl-D-glutamate--2,6-diaminopimelate ligase [Clostridia bacterium]|nr:UDP-N-acetylmuramoyl-L-alanyl-D-glutamate--2,6-diaminopimelate ligase [Clostridia bacterium]
MKLSKLVEKLSIRVLQGNLESEITGLTSDSRKVTQGGAFVCIVGAVTDGHRYIKDVAAKNVSAVIVQKQAGYEQYFEDGRLSVDASITVIEVDDTRFAYAIMSAAWFDYPAEKLFTIGITGTKGKTTTTYMVKNVLESCGHKTGLIGTIETIIGDEHTPSHNTTPESYEIQEKFAKMAEAGCEAVVMEVSSQGLMLHRTAGIQFNIGVFTNIEPDHIGPNEHSSFEDYLKCKAMLFKQCDVGIVNGDDEHIDQILDGASCTIEKYGFGEDVDIKASDKELLYEHGKIGTKYHVSGLEDLDVELCMPGNFSIYNSLCAIAVTRHFNVDKDKLKKALFEVKVRGRIEIIDVHKDFTIMVDYAHNAMALESLLKTLKEYNPKRIVTVFGCGGNRDRSRRFEMGEVSGRIADFTIITSDNPRNEKPEDIMADIVTGISKTSGKHIEIADRAEAIKYAVDNARPGDVIVVAGKGHEDYQEINGVKHHMDDRELVLDAVG